MRLFVVIFKHCVVLEIQWLWPDLSLFPIFLFSDILWLAFATNFFTDFPSIKSKWIENLNLERKLTFSSSTWQLNLVWIIIILGNGFQHLELMVATGEEEEAFSFFPPTVEVLGAPVTILRLLWSRAAHFYY